MRGPRSSIGALEGTDWRVLEDPIASVIYIQGTPARGALRAIYTNVWSIRPVMDIRVYGGYSPMVPLR